MGSTRKRKGDSLPNEAAAKAPKGSNGKKKAKRIKQPENQYLSDVLKLKAAWPEDMGHLLARLGIDEVCTLNSAVIGKPWALWRCPGCGSKTCNPSPSFQNQTLGLSKHATRLPAFDVVQNTA